MVTYLLALLATTKPKTKPKTETDTEPEEVEKWCL